MSAVLAQLALAGIAAIACVFVAMSCGVASERGDVPTARLTFIISFILAAVAVTAAALS